MFTPKFFLAVIVIAVAVIVIQWFFVGFLFHRFQAKTPATWRKESWGSYMLSSLVSLLFSFMFVTLFWVWKSNCDCAIDFVGGAIFGFIFWLAFSLTAELGSAIYINYSRRFLLGKCISGLVEYVAAGIIASAIL